MAKEGESKPLNASGLVLEDLWTGLRVLGLAGGVCVRPVYDGVTDREFTEEDEPVAASMEKTSLFASLRTLSEVVDVEERSARVRLAVCLAGGEEFQRSAKESAMRSS